MIDGQDRGGHDPGKAEQRADDDLFKLVNTYFVLATKSYLRVGTIYLLPARRSTGKPTKILT